MRLVLLVPLLLVSVAGCAEPDYGFNSLDGAFDGEASRGDARRDAASRGDGARGDAGRRHDSAVDATHKESDAGRDAARDGGSDVGTDAGDDARRDAGHHPPHDGGRDAKRDAESDAGHCGAACVEGPPDGWTGPVALFEGDAAAPSCGAAYPTSAYSGQGGLNAPPAECSACGCVDVSGGTCGTSVTDLGTGCGSNCDVGISLPNGACMAIPSSPAACQAAGVGFDSDPESGSPSCSPAGGSPTGAAASFSTVGLACAPSVAPTSAGCSAHGLCAPAGPPGFALCIEASGGDVACPTGSPYRHAHLFFTGYADGRTCSGCACTPGACDGTISFYADGSCSAGIGDISPGGGCAGPEPDMSAGSVMYLASPSCSPSGGAPSGSVVGTSPTTFCCLE